MASILRTWSYQYQWFYDTISRLAALSVGGEARFHKLPLQGLTITSETKVLDLCCGSGQATKYLVYYSQDVTGLDMALVSLERARRNVAKAQYVEALAQEMPFPDNQFDLVHTSVAMHEMKPSELQQILKEVYRVLKPGGVFALVDFHKPTNFLFWPGLTLFLWLFETETSWQLLETDLVELLKDVGFEVLTHALPAGGSLQVIQVRK
ncbi:MAG: methyltransferase domain-containing protein [Symplocastrum torsivum CPER-KK1]|uniref:Methyltransferase domain-containing protein n=1 Tax=Symplocastrum torsivum CPER-KK1 TaxID=450513 RepID=A0A951PNS4_9CYAN|nr:methyltransferase domain-containing protein [Symplocastrum torsivum CPER-KK1]